MNEKIYPYIAILGPTASGKSDLAIRLAKDLDGEIICCDSIQIYKYLNIASAKPSLEERKLVPHHLFDFLELKDSFDASQYSQKAREIIQKIISQKKLPIVVGGTGLYFRFLIGDRFHNFPNDSNLKKELSSKSNLFLMDFLQQCDPERAQQIHINDKYRLMRAVELFKLTGKTLEQNRAEQNIIDSFKPCYSVLLSKKREELHENIDFRVKKMFSTGLIDEVISLLDQGYDPGLKPLQSIGYKEVIDFLLHNKNMSKDELSLKIVSSTRQYAKRQETWNKKIAIDFKFSDHSCYQDLVKNIKISYTRVLAS